MQPFDAFKEQHDKCLLNFWSGHEGLLRVRVNGNYLCNFSNLLAFNQTICSKCI